MIFEITRYLRKDRFARNSIKELKERLETAVK